MNKQEIEAAVEAILFAVGDMVSGDLMADALEVSLSRIDEAVKALMQRYQTSGFKILSLDGDYQLCSNPNYYEYIRRVVEPRRQQGLSNAALETLAIIAYTQPTTRSNVEFIRGVDCTGPISRLLEKGLIEVAGRMDTPGKPRIYKTTKEFLRCFGIENIKDLPEVQNIIGEMV